MGGSSETSNQLNSLIINILVLNLARKRVVSEQFFFFYIAVHYLNIVKL